LVKVSDWVHTVHNQNKITGFITAINDNKVNVFVTIPKEYGEIEVLTNDIIESNNRVWMDDIPSIIDLSIQIRDKEWFEKWTNEMRKWKKVNEVF
jgi:uncharacterized protein YkvS